MSNQEESITCPKCGRTSFNPHDVRAGYCGSCNEFTGEVSGITDRSAQELAIALTEAIAEIREMKQAVAVALGHLGRSAEPFDTAAMVLRRTLGTSAIAEQTPQPSASQPTGGP
jgi:ribosomal protein L37AE/L43A